MNGFVVTKDDVKKYLTEYNKDYAGRKVWESMYANIDLSKQQQLNQATELYRSEIADAYRQAYDARTEIMASNIGQGYKMQALDQTQLALEQAYDAYRSNYLESTGKIESAAAQANAGITEYLDEEAEMASKVANTPYEYLQSLYEQFSEGDDKNNIFLTDEQWKKYTEEDAETGETKLKSWEDILQYGAYDEENKEWTGMYDKEGNITIKGIDFYDQMFNALANTQQGQSYGNWLAKKDPELYNWLSTSNNFAQIKEMFGMKGTDEDYSFIERFGGMSKKDLDKQFSSFQNTLSGIDKLISSSNGTNSEQVQTAITNATNELKRVADSLGITRQIESSMGMSFDDLGRYYGSTVNTAVSEGQMAGTGVASTLSSVGVGALVGAKVVGASTLLATKIGSAAGPVGAAIGALVGAVIGIGLSVDNANKQKSLNKVKEQAARDAYNDLVTSFVKFAETERKNVQNR